MKHVIRLTLFALLPILAACHSSASGHASTSMALKIYDVPPSKTHALSTALGRVLSKDGSVVPAGPGKLLVYAPEEAQTSIRHALDSLRDSTPAETAPTQIELHFWVIDAEPGTAPDDPALKVLAPSLDSLRQTTGAVSFHLEQASAVAASENYPGSLTTTSHNAPHVFNFDIGAIQGDALSLELEYQDSDTGSAGLKALQTQIDTRFGQYNVLAQAPNNDCAVASHVGISSSSQASGGANSPSSAGMTESKTCQRGWRVLIVRADRAATSSH